MNKTLKYSVAGLLLIIVIGFIVLTLSLDYLVKSEIEAIGSEMTATSVTVEKVSISPLSGKGSIEGLKVDNPEGFKKDHAISMSNISIHMDPYTILSDTIAIRQIIITKPSVAVTQKVPQNNLNILMRNMEESLASSESSSNMVIEHLLVKEGEVTVSATFTEGKSATVKMDTIELNKIGEEGSSSTRQVIVMVTERLMKEALKVALSGGLDKLKNEAGEAIEDMIKN